MPVTVPTRLRGTSITTGTGSYATGSAFSATLTNGEIVFYEAIDRATGAWEAGKGTWAVGGALARTQIYATSTGATTAVSWAAGTRDLILTLNPRGVGSPGEVVGSDALAAEAATRLAADTANATAISNHVADTNNPHGTTAAQLNVYTKTEANTANATTLASAKAYTDAAVDPATPRLVRPPGPFADDAAAAVGGVPVGVSYRTTSNVVVVRAV